MEGRLHSQTVGGKETADALLFCLRVRSVGLEVWWPGQDKEPRPNILALQGQQLGETNQEVAPLH